MSARRPRSATPGSQATAPPPCIALLTDFGERDGYAGVMRGVIATLAPGAIVVDISHEVEAHDVRAGAYLLATSYRWFPRGTIHVAVVDPGVGGDRKILAALHAGYAFLAPDNGLLGGVLAGSNADRMVEVTEGRYFLTPVSSTFHGRDIFAPVAAHLARGVPLEAFGPPAVPAVPCPWPAPEPAHGGSWRGEVIYIDRFGNCVTNIPLASNARGRARVSGHSIRVETGYSKAVRGEPVAVSGSSGYLEIAVREGSAGRDLALGRGTPVVWEPGP